MPDAYYVAAVSGGADSMAMLHMLMAQRPRALWVCHLHHGLRGSEADRDARFVQSICREWGIRCVLRYENAAAAAERLGCSVEDAGRRLRYAFFEQTADALAVQEGIDPALVQIATAHTMSDNAETVLMHLIRGAGLHGLTGIPPQRGRIVRPVLSMTRTQIEQYCEKNGLSYVQDSTNESNAYTRNRIRHELLPLLRAENPAIEQTLCRMTALLREEDALLDVLAAPFAEGEDAWDRTAIAAQPAALRRRIAYAVLNRCGVTPDSTRIERLNRLIAAGQGALGLDGDRVLRADARQIRLEHRSAPLPEATDAVVGGETAFGDWRLCLMQTENREEITKKITENNLKNTLDCDTIKGTLHWRTRRPGERFAVAGHTGSKPLKKLMNEYALPDRARYPLLCDEEGVVLIPGVGCAQRNAVTKQTVRLLQAAVRKEIKNQTDSAAGRNKDEVTPMSKLLDNIESILVSEEALQARIAELGAQITADYGDEPVLMVGVLKGSVVFMADLMRKIDLNVSIEFMAVSSYGSGTQSSGQVQVLKDLGHPIEGKNVLIIEDILDSGVTLSFLRKLLESRQPKSIRICTLMDKPDRRKADVLPDYKGFTIPDEFVVGYGLDYDEAYRHLPFVGVLKRSVYETK